ncbi:MULTISPECIES: penicillin-binding protein 1C [unclassified Oceanobacter]|uniref:penicillin-binding protein 1C n=1 Tax=unclassified Oceanobacter TaxID=2620260 RepID=UPI0027346209|nr:MULTISPECIES: penicillin-binding protein 1C [unclassified Oceanobacter]MDP2608877.1 penicillin-binding protein 1C [Oceanobacter sp. 1_MG-2023]MDP2611881.1 penicillin-binding protein 1C [Oceanobacter sp. 2_MG-2023]
MSKPSIAKRRARPRQHEHQHRQQPEQPTGLRWVIWLGAGTALLILLALLLNWRYPLQLPEHNQQAFSRVVVDRHGRTLRAFPDAQGVWRLPVTLDQIAPDYLAAVLHYEDRWFYHHPGINPFAIARAAWQNLQCGCVVSGGSTLTMQVARRLYPHHRNLSGKLQQALRALQLEWQLGKEEILTLYLNYVPMGGVIEGVEAAAQMYLDKPAAELSLSESALLAVLPQAPSRLRPDRHPQRARAARDKVLRRLLRFEAISPHAYQQALLDPVFARQPDTPQQAPLLARHLIQRYPQQPLIHTTLDGDLQREISRQLQRDIQLFPRHHSAAVLVVHNPSHEIRVYSGTADFGNPQRLGHVDMVQAIRSPGSTLKPFIYGLALDQGLIHGASLLTDAPRLRQAYQPGNFSAGFSGPVSPPRALNYSLNLPAVQVLEALTPARFYAALSNAGFHYQLPDAARPNLSLALGGGGVSLWQLVMLYSSLMNQGQVFPLQPLLSAAHTHSLPSRPAINTPPIALPNRGRQLLSPEAAWVTADWLRNPLPNRTRSVDVIQPRTFGWKTGTSYGFRDSWAIGITPEYTVGVWFGRPDGTPSPGYFGAVTAMPALQRIMTMIDRRPRWPEPPPPVQAIDACWPLGRLLSDTPDDQCHRTVTGWSIRQLVPPTLPDSANPGAPNPLPVLVNQHGQRVNAHCDRSGTPTRLQSLALWPIMLESWIPASQRLSQQLPSPAPGCESSLRLERQLQITGIEPGEHIRASQNNPAGEHVLPSLTLSANGGVGTRSWYINGEYRGSSTEQQPLTLSLRRAGAQQIVLIDNEGNSDRITVYAD